VRSSVIPNLAASRPLLQIQTSSTVVRRVRGTYCGFSVGFLALDVERNTGVA